jgi:hypothetical protein
VDTGRFMVVNPGISASCCFRAVPESWDEAVIQKIAGLGHEIGYHYEKLSTCRGDTGRRWNHAGAGIRDRVNSGFDIRVNSTGQLMELARQGRLPERVMINTHPQRWEDRAWPWVKELVWQNVKNGVKKIVLSFKC